METDGSLKRYFLWDLEVAQDLHCVEEVDLIETKEPCGFDWPDSESVKGSTGFNESSTHP